MKLYILARPKSAGQTHRLGAQGRVDVEAQVQTQSAGRIPFQAKGQSFFS